MVARQARREQLKRLHRAQVLLWLLLLHFTFVHFSVKRCSGRLRPTASVYFALYLLSSTTPLKNYFLCVSVMKKSNTGKVG